jgi:hypothetical protein
MRFYEPCHGDGRAKQSSLRYRLGSEPRTHAGMTTAGEIGG